ncbi:MAG: DUF4434 domain-containing protein [bacterium]
MTPHSSKPSKKSSKYDSIHSIELARPERHERFFDVIDDSLRSYPKKKLATLPGGFRPPAQPAHFITGTFVSLSSPEQIALWTNPKWTASEFRAMRSAGFDTLFVWPGFGTTCCYPFRKFGFSATAGDPAAALLESAGKAGFRVYLSLPSLMHDWMVADPDELDAVVRRSASIAESMIGRYGDHAHLEGWYVPYELCDGFILESRDPALLPGFLGRLSSAFRRLDPLRPVAQAPYFRTRQDLSSFARFWKRVLETAGMDILVMQDTVGKFKEDRIAETPAYYSILQEVCLRLGVRFWTDLEVYDLLHGVPLDYKSWAAKPAAAQRVFRQVATQSPYVEKIICWQFQTFMSPNAVDPAARRLYRDYSRWIATQRLARNHPRK